MPGLPGEFANLEAKRDAEIPMCVLLPSGCKAVRPRISGTDIDGVRNVDSVTFLYEIKAEGKTVDQGQRLALEAIGDAHVVSNWRYRERTDRKVVELKHYPRYAVPVKASIFGHTRRVREWLAAYLDSVGLKHAMGNNNEFVVTFSDPEAALDTHVFEPTEEWLHVAWAADHYAAFLKSGKTIDQAFPHYCNF